MLPTPVDRILYNVTNKNWPSLNNPVLKKLYQEKVDISFNSASAPNWRINSRITVLGMLLLSSAIFVALFLGGLKKSKNPK